MKSLKKWTYGLLLMAVILVLAACGNDEEVKDSEADTAGESSSEASASKEVVDLRMNVVSTGTQAIPVYLIKKLELDKKYGFNLVEVADSGAVNANWTAYKTGQVDAMISDWISLSRNIKQGEEIQAVVPFLGWGNGVLVKNDAAISSLEDLKDQKIGIYSRISPDWVMMKVAAKKLYGFDIEAENKINESAPGLLLGLMGEGELDVALNYGDLNNRLAGTGEFKIPFLVSDVMHELDLSSDVPFLFYVFSKDFIEKHPETVEAYAKAYKDAINFMNTDPDIWTELAANMDISDEPTINLIKTAAKAKIFTDLPANSQENIEKIYEVLTSELGADELGFEKVPADLIWTP